MIGLKFVAVANRNPNNRKQLAICRLFIKCHGTSRTIPWTANLWCSIKRSIKNCGGLDITSTYTAALDMHVGLKYGCCYLLAFLLSYVVIVQKVLTIWQLKKRLKIARGHSLLVVGLSNWPEIGYCPILWMSEENFQICENITEPNRESCIK